MAARAGSIPDHAAPGTCETRLAITGQSWADAVTSAQLLHTIPGSGERKDQ
jgi:hypothetical protein